MERMSRFRIRALLLFFVLILTFFGFRLYDEQIYKTGGVIDNSTTYTTWTRVRAARGDILDSSGNKLVGNRASYDVTINHYILLGTPNPNQMIYQMIELCNELGVDYNDHFPVTKTRPFTYTLDEYNSAWRGYFQTFLHERGEMDSDISAPLLIETLRKSYEIPEEWTDEVAREVIGVRYELSLRNYTTLPLYVFLSDAPDEGRAAILELNIPGMNVEATTVREYYTTLAAHILGYTGAMSPDQWAHYKTIDGYSMDAEVGQSGFELAFEEYLHGSDGARIDTFTQDGTLVDSYYDPAPIPGNNVEVTIDLELQAAAEAALEKQVNKLKNDPDVKKAGHDVQGASVVAMDVKTGRILACASYPTYNLATFREDYDTLKEDKLKPLYNRALQAAYPPGSTYKMSMVIAGTRSGVINMESKIEDLGLFDKYAPGFTAECLIYSQTSGEMTHGHVNAAEALCVSCNYFFYYLADHDLFTLEIMEDTAKGLGLGVPSGVELPEHAGQIANQETKKKLYKENITWTRVDQVQAGIGQSDNRFTPLQLCVYVNTLANRGTRYAATFLNRVVSPDYRNLILENPPEILSVLDIPNDAYLSYTEGMKMVASDPAGTGYKVFSDYPIQISAKTGTAQIGINGASDHGAFVCFAPSDDPQIAIAVLGERAGSGSSMGWVARDILDQFFDVGEKGDVESFENLLS